MDRKAWNKLSSAEKDTIMSSLPGKLKREFVYKGLQTFERYGVTHETGVFRYEEQEFIFVPGDQVTLGWSDLTEKMDNSTHGDLLDAAKEGEFPDVEHYLRERMSPVRQASIGAMLVESEVRSAGWNAIPLEELSSLDDPDVVEALAKFRDSTYKSYEQYQYFRLCKDENDAIIAYLFNDHLSEEQLASELKLDGFELPTEDEWEYLYGGGLGRQL